VLSISIRDCFFHDQIAQPAAQSGYITLGLQYVTWV